MLTSGDLIDLSVLRLDKVDEVDFLVSLGVSLESAVNRGLDIARRIGWTHESSFIYLGSLNRVYYTKSKSGDERGQEADAHHRGIAPSVKLLFSVVSRIKLLDKSAAVSFVGKWRMNNSPIHIRLWAAAAQNHDLVDAEDVTSFLVGTDDRLFWDLHLFPEVAELRATRFNDINRDAQLLICQRIEKGPPRDFWPKRASGEKLNNARLFWSARELRRIEIADGTFPNEINRWLADNIKKFQELNVMRPDEGFPEEVTVHSVSHNPDDRYDALDGLPRLRAIESALASERVGWDDHPAERANSWLNQGRNAQAIVADLQRAADGGDSFPKLWNRLGWAYSPRQPDESNGPERNLQREANVVLGLLEQLSDRTIRSAIEGLTYWLDSWAKQVVASPIGLPVWLRIWPLAVEVTNASPKPEDGGDLGVSARAIDPDEEPMDLDTLNTPAGRMVGVFLAACPNLESDGNPFAAGKPARVMRDIVIAASNRSGLIARHRLIEGLPYFLRADQEWTRTHLTLPLFNDDSSSLVLWRAIARRTHFTKVLSIIGGAMAERAVDRRLARETRRRLVFSLVVEFLHAFHESRDPAVPNSRVQQMLRTIDDEVRASAANAIQQFIQELSSKGAAGVDTPSAAELFRSAAKPFLESVWPQERSLATPSVSRALSDLPAASGEAFAEAFDVIERFLVPFECWSMIDYGLYGKGDGDHPEEKLAIIDDEPKAAALLKLLDRTVGTSEGAVIPYDLTDALDRIRSVAPGLAETAIYRRLATAARR